MNRREAVSFGQQRQTLNDGLLGMVTAIEDGANRFYERLSTSPALIPLSACLGSSESPNVTLVHLTIVRALRIPAESAWMDEV